MSDRTVVVSDSLARANVLAALAGPGAPAGILSCTQSQATISITFDDTRTSAALIDAVVAVAAAFVPARSGPIEDLDTATAIAARGLNEPALDRTRIIEMYLP